MYLTYPWVISETELFSSTPLVCCSEFSGEQNSFVSSTSSPEDIISMVELSDDTVLAHVLIFSRSIVSITTSAERNKTLK